MKGKRASKRITKAGQPPASFDLAQFNAMKPAEILAMTEPMQGIPADRLQNFARLLDAGLGLNEAPPDTPEWAINAARELTKHVEPPKKKSDDYRLAWQMGLSFNFIPLFKLPEAGQGNLAKLAEGLSSFIRSHASQLPTSQAADIFDGLRDGEQSAPRLTHASQRTKLFVLIAFLWPEVARFKSTGELYQCLLSSGAIVPSTDSCEIRAVCAKINLRFNPPGRPRNRKM